MDADPDAAARALGTPAAPSTMPRIDLNADVGEERGDDLALLEIVTSVNLATGAHAGGGAVLSRVTRAAVARGVLLGAHPSYRDRAGFGRASLLEGLRADRQARRNFVADLAGQILDVADEAEAAGSHLHHVKAHGALYNEAVVDDLAAALVLEAVTHAHERYGRALAIVTQPGGVLASAAAGVGVSVVAEGFVDRAYGSSGRLVPRSRPGAVHHDPAAMVRQALDLVRGRVRSSDGAHVVMVVASLCVHGDTPGAVAAARAVRGALERHGWLVTAPTVAGARSSSGGTGRAAGALGAPTVVAPDLADHEDHDLRVHPFGDRGWLLEPAAARSVAALLRLAHRAQRAWPGCLVVPGLASVLVARSATWDGMDDAVSAGNPDRDWPRSSDEVLAGLAAHVAPGSAAGAGHRTHVLTVRYEGPDLDTAAEDAGVTSAELVARHTEAQWTVAAVGFSPGFGYLTSTDPVFAAVRRRADPRTRVPAGAIALAAGMCAVYPSATPGGWQLVGSTDAVLWDPGLAQPARFRVGDLVRFRGA